MKLPLDSPLALGTYTKPASILTPRQTIEKVLAQLPSRDAGTGEELVAAQRDKLVAHTQRVNGVLRNYGVEFRIAGDPPRTITQVVDSETREIIRQVPSEEVLKISDQLAEQLAGLRGLLLQRQV